jgi:hypothetical protein
MFKAMTVQGRIARRMVSGLMNPHAMEAPRLRSGRCRLGRPACLHAIKARTAEAALGVGSYGNSSGNHRGLDTPDSLDRSSGDPPYRAIWRRNRNQCPVRPVCPAQGSEARTRNAPTASGPERFGVLVGGV